MIEIFIYKDNLLNNLRAFQLNYPDLQFAPVLKANAYGHGLEQVLTVLKDQQLPFVAVDSFYEALIAQKYAPKLQILVIGYSRLDSIEKAPALKNSFSLVSLDQLKEISAKLRTKKRFHLKLDTGMHRQGIMLANISKTIELIKQNPKIILEGLSSHLAEPENMADTNIQIANWNDAIKIFKNEFPQIKYTHLAATAGARFSSKIHANLVRLGIGFYGIYTKEGLQLKPALEMRSIITGINNIGRGEKVGYGFTFTAKQKMKIATVPAGFFEGVDRRLSNTGYFKIGQNFCPIAGRVSMNISTIDVSSIADARLGDSVTIISHNPTDANSVQNIASVCGTVNYDILVHIPQHLKRTVI